MRMPVKGLREWGWSHDEKRRGLLRKYSRSRGAIMAQGTHTHAYGSERTNVTSANVAASSVLRPAGQLAQACESGRASLLSMRDTYCVVRQLTRIFSFPFITIDNRIYWFLIAHYFNVTIYRATFIKLEVTNKFPKKKKKLIDRNFIRPD